MLGNTFQFASLSAALLFAGAVSAQAVSPPADMERRMAACTACHGSEGRATNIGYFPSLAGKPERYLFEQLRNFRDGRRRQADMEHLLANLSDAYLHEMAGHFATQPLPYSPPTPSNLSAEQLERGRVLMFEGDSRQDIPACASCHGERLTGVQPGIPGLLGLPRAYIAAQLGAWVAGQRSAAAPDCMAEVGRKLAGTDVQAVVGWLASQPMPGNPLAAESPPGELPMPCSALEASR